MKNKSIFLTLAALLANAAANASPLSGTNPVSFSDIGTWIPYTLGMLIILSSLYAVIAAKSAIRAFENS